MEQNQNPTEPQAQKQGRDCGCGDCGNCSVFEKLGSKYTFVFGAIAGVLTLCTVGFFILLAMTFSGGGMTGGSLALAGEPESLEGPEDFSECLATNRYASLVNADMNLGAQHGVQGTPATIINGYLLSGAMPYSVVEDVVKDLLAGKKPFIDNYEQLGLESGDLENVGEPKLEDAVVWLGNEKAKVTIVEFSDFECPYCARFYATMEQVLANYSDDIKFTYRHFPLSFHEYAQVSAEAFECAKEQGKAFEMYDKLFELSGAGTLNEANIMSAASELGLK